MRVHTPSLLFPQDDQVPGWRVWAGPELQPGTCTLRCHTRAPPEFGEQASPLKAAVFGGTISDVSSGELISGACLFLGVLPSPRMGAEEPGVASVHPQCKQECG